MKQLGTHVYPARVTHKTPGASWRYDTCDSTPLLSGALEAGQAWQELLEVNMRHVLGRLACRGSGNQKAKGNGPAPGYLVLSYQ